MKHLLITALAGLVAFGSAELPSASAEVPEGVKGRKVYNCSYMKNPPRGALAWSQSDMVKSGKNKEDRFVAYNSEAAKKLWLDATTVRTYEADPKLKGRETSFYQVYDETGWHVYIESKEPNVQELVDSGKGGGSIELFFVPGLENVYYHQMIFKQPGNTSNYYDWGMPHKGYRSLKDFAKVDSQAVEGAFGTYLFYPWEALYDRLPLNGDYWRFSFMRWSTRVTWGGNVHDTGNFGIVKFEKASEAVKSTVQRNMLKKAWYKFQRTEKQVLKVWADEKIGDKDFYETVLKPELDKHRAAINALGKPDQWDPKVVASSLKFIPDWMEFEYVVADLRTEFLRTKHFK